MRAFFIITFCLVSVGVAAVVAWATIGNNDPNVRVETQSTPIVSIEETEFDFGIIDPYGGSQHRFLITNKGNGVLRLQKAGVSCSCTKGEIVNPVLQPGDTTEVIVAWETAKRAQFFQQYLKIRTNDPLHEEIKLIVHGKVLAKLAADKQDLNFGSVSPDEKPHGLLLVYSHIWDDLKIEEITTSWKGAKWTVEPAPEEELKSRGAKSAFLVKIEGPKLTGAERFHEWMRIKGGPEVNSNELQNLDIEINGSAKRYISVYGDHVTSDGVLEFDILEQGKEFVSRSFVKVRGEHKDIQFEDIEVKPDFVKARISKYNVGDAQGLFHLTITIPADAPIAYHRKANQGTITLSSNHPTEPELTLGLDFQIYEN